MNTILIVDDDQDFLDLIRFEVKQLGWDVIGVDNGYEALQILREEDVDVVLTDIAMPDMDGYELYKQIRNFNDEIPIIMMTGFGYDPNHVLVKAKQSGLQDILFKPFEIDDLEDILEQYF